MARDKNYDVKAVEQGKSINYTDFGWIRSRQPIPSDLAIKTKKPTILLKRRAEYGMNPIISSNELEFERLYKKNYKGKNGKTVCAVIFGILVGVLMLAFIAGAALELYFGISKGLDAMQSAEEASNAAAVVDVQEKEEDGFIDILEQVHDDYVTYVTEFLDGTYLRDSEGKVIKNADDEYVLDASKDAKKGLLPDSLKEMEAPVGYFMNTDTILGVVCLLLGIIFIIIFSSICKMGRRQNKRAAKMAEAVAAAKAEIDRMRKTDVALMTRAQRKQYYWEAILTNSFIKSRTPIAPQYDNDDDGYDF